MYYPTINELSAKKVETTLHRKAEGAFRFLSLPPSLSLSLIFCMLYF